MPHTSYSALATGDTPALIVFLLDASGSMSEPFPGYPTKAACVKALMEDMFETLIGRCMAGEEFKQRYHVAMIAYDDAPASIAPPAWCIDTYAPPEQRMLIQVDTIANEGVPEINPGTTTNTRGAFQLALKLLQRETPRRVRSATSGRPFPAPIVCHLTDGAWNTGGHPAQVVEAIQSLRNEDGGVLVCNIFLGSGLLAVDIGPDVRAWRGVRSRDELAHEHARRLFDISSPLPPSYANFINDSHGYSIEPGTRMLFPSETPEVLKLAFAVAGGTPSAARGWRG
jgi:hypothetical protein